MKCLLKRPCLLGLILALLLTGCQTQSYRTTLTPLDMEHFAPSSEDEGYLVGSFSYNGRPPSYLGVRPPFRYTFYGFYFRNLEDSEILGDIAAAVPHATSRRNPPDFELEEGGGAVLVIPLPAGRYEFYDFRLVDNGPAAHNTWKARDPFSIPFTIEPGRATYIGEVRANHLFGRNFIGLPLPIGAIFGGLDQADRDIPILVTQFPFLRDLPVDRRVLNVAVEGLFQPNWNDALLAEQDEAK